MADPIRAFEGVRPIVKGVFFAYPATPLGSWPVSPPEAMLGSARPLIAQATTPVFRWPGKTALVLGPSSWGFGIGAWGSTAHPISPAPHAQAGWY